MFNIHKYAKSISLENDCQDLIESDNIVNDDISLVQVDPKQQLVDITETISQEANFATNAINIINKRGANFAIAARNAFTSMTNWSNQIIPEFHPAQMRHLVSHIDYLEVANTIVSQPVGFNGEIPDYVDYLLTEAKEMATIIPAVLDPVKAQLGYYLQQRADRMDKRGFANSFAMASINDLAKDASFYDSDNRSSTAEFGKLYPSLNSFVDATKKMNDIRNILSRVRPNDVKRASEALSQLIDSFMEDVKDSNSDTSPELLQTLIEGVTWAADHVERYSTLFTKIVETANTMKATEDILREIIG
ncbi:hypothetical protein [Pseudomonas phage U1B]|nr:hypothetical protein [Pseudomonas phage T2P]QYV99344.1 hypothetical protein [Pseudomonas phage U1B]QYV99800.1 hypothetical protein [Pseudomonas phage U5]